MVIRILLLLLILVAGAVYSITARKLTVPAAITGVVLALCVYGGEGFTGLAMMTTFFIAGSAATSWKMKWKRQQGLAESVKGTRTAMQVIANAGVAALCGLVELAYAPFEWYPLMPIMMAAAFAAATADTLSSELGNVYGSRYYNILSFRKDQRGLNGVISLEGTLLGVAGSLLIALIFVVGFGRASGLGGVVGFGRASGSQGIASFISNAQLVGIILLAGTIGNLADSLLGATLERKGWIGNNAVNFLNTAIGAASVWVLQFL
jgi:uncharacterized protein (TIGR00297 family)